MEDLFTVYIPDAGDKDSRGSWLYLTKTEPSSNIDSWFPQYKNDIMFGLDLSFMLHNAIREDSTATELWVAICTPKKHASLSQCRLHGRAAINAPLKWCKDNLELNDRLPTFKVKLDPVAFRLIAKYDVYQFRQAMKMKPRGFSLMTPLEQVASLLQFTGNAWGASCCLVAMMETVDPTYQVFHDWTTETNIFTLHIARVSGHHFTLICQETSNSEQLTSEPFMDKRRGIAAWIFPGRYKSFFRKEATAIGTTGWWIDHSGASKRAFVKNGVVHYKFSETEVVNGERPDFLEWLDAANEE